MLPVDRISGNKEVQKDAPYLLHHSNTWECEEDISTSYASYAETYILSITQKEIIKVEEMEGETYEGTNLLIGNRIAGKGRASALPMLKKENVVSERTSTEESNINQHKLSHDGVKAFCCDQCEKRFALKCNLNRHKLTHGGMKPFSCHQCEKRFVNKAELNQHGFTHSGLKPFSCDQCEKRFVHKGHLNQHKLTHGDVKHFSQ